MSSRTLAFAATVASCVPVALAQVHLTVDVQPGSNQIAIRAGYLPGETANISFGYLLDGSGRFAILDAQQRLTGQLDGSFAGSGLVLTSDFYAPTGRLDGGDFRWEIAYLREIVDNTTPTLAWGDFQPDGSFIPSALSNGSTRADRSFGTTLGSHDDQQGFAFASEGTIEVWFVAWDANGVYADSQPLVVRFSVGAGCHFDLNHDGVVDQGDIDYWFIDDNPSGIDYDINQDGVGDLGDVLDLVNAIAGGGCP
ncbi:MAG: hypothetical protein GC200_00865 [Tepidisphaera sp.]|nr:hypothetical protein [Tepidisphaera sp.]